MERHLKNIEAWCWRYLENTRNYPGLHFTARNSACEAILQALDRLRRDSSESHRTITLRQLDPADEAAISGGQRFTRYTRLRLALHSESEELRQFSFRVVAGTVRFDLTERYLSEFQKGIRDVQSGSGDYSIAPNDSPRKARLMGSLDAESEDLWFWPCFGHLYPVR